MMGEKTSPGKEGSQGPPASRSRSDDGTGSAHEDEIGRDRLDLGRKDRPRRVERTGAEPTVLLLPAMSSISTRGEMRPLQERLAPCVATVTVTVTVAVAVD